MAPTLVNSYYVEATDNAQTALVTPSFTPSVGEIIVAKIVCADANQQVGTPAVTGFTTGTITSRVNIGTGSSGCRVAIFTCAVTASAAGTFSSGTFTTGNVARAMVVERWSNAQLAATPATASILVDTAAPFTQTITTAANNSVVSYAMADWQAANAPSGVAYVGDTATPTAEQSPTNMPNIMYNYWLYQAAATAGSQTWGTSAPASNSMTGAAIEIQDSGGGPQTYNVPVDDNRGLTDQLQTEYTPGPGTMVWTTSVGIG